MNSVLKFIKYITGTLLFTILTIILFFKFGKGDIIFDMSHDKVISNEQIVKRKVTIENEKYYKLAALCELWGFLKYHHPALTEKKINWDNVLIKYIPIVINTNNTQLSLEKFIEEVGEILCAKNEGVVLPLAKHYWITDSSIISPLIQKKLSILNKCDNEKNDYIKYTQTRNPNFSNEDCFMSLTLPNMEMRLLGLFRFWNIINYFYPYKNLIIENWGDLLLRFIPIFIASTNEATYNRAIIQLGTSINDAHAMASSDYIDNMNSKIYVGGFLLSIIDGELVVRQPLIDGIALEVQKGDIIKSINGIPIKILKDSLAKIVPASNISSQNRNICYFLEQSPQLINSLEIERLGNKVTLPKVNYHPVKSLKELLKKQRFYAHTEVDTIQDSIVYIDAARITNQEFDDLLDKLKSNIVIKKIILDLRCYPSLDMYAICSRLAPVNNIIPFAKFTYPDIYHPSYMRELNTPYHIQGGDNSIYPNKTVRVLVNEQTQSFAEFFTMALQSIPNIKVIGSQTAGADGNVSEVCFPGNITLLYSGVGVFYPDMKPTQQVGVRIDVIQNPTIKGIQQGRDEILECAIKN